LTTKFLIALFFIPFFSKAQLLLTGNSGNSDNSFSFNPSEIKNRKIKSITFEIVDKKDFQIVEDKDLSKHYEFDLEGRLKRSYYTVIKRIIQKDFHTAPVYRHNRLVNEGGVYSKSIYEFDTLSTNYFYDANGNLVGKRFNDGSFYNATYYQYDSIGRVISLLSCKESNTNADKNVFTLGMQQINFREKYKYIHSSSKQYKQQYLNDENRVFKELIVTFNAAKQPLQYNESYVATWINQVTDFTYNDKNLLIEKKYTSNASSTIELKETYEYDSNGLLNTEKHYKNSVLQTETGYVNDADTKLLNSFVTRDYINKTMQIVKLVYGY
jgi:YD repeat-containing protein